MHRRDGGAAQSLRRQFSRRWGNLRFRRKSPPVRHQLSTKCVFVAKKQSSAKRKRKGCRLRLRRRRGSNLPNNGASWRTGLNVHHQVTDGGAQAGLDKRGRGSNRDTLAERLKSLAPFSHRTAACLALKSAFGTTELRGFRLKVCEPHWYVARGAYGVREL